MIDVKVNWEDCCMSFVCPKCGEELIADSQNGPEVCSCGLKYKLISKLKIEYTEDQLAKV